MYKAMEVTSTGKGESADFGFPAVKMESKARLFHLTDKCISFNHALPVGTALWLCPFRMLQYFYFGQ